jgi:glycosyltransferase involved in cell wall biosynthesis
MPRFIGVKNNHISIISDKYFECADVQIIELPSHLENISSDDLITNYKIKNGKLVAKLGSKPIKELKIALVSNWKMQCGIATYAENLWTEVVKKLDNFKLFIEKNEITTGSVYEIGDKALSADQVSSCWKRGESLQQLVSEIKDYDPDIVWIQHEFGLWPNAMYWLSLMNQLSEYRVIVTMHSVFHHKDKTICEAAMPEIVTHLQGGHDVLKHEKQIPGKVYVIPHGCFPCTDRDRLWNFYKSNNTFMQFGFGFRYKGWENSIRATAVLKEKYSDVFFTGLFSESPYNKVEHQIYYDELMALVHELGIQENVAIIRGFQSEATLDSYMRTNQATIFPYISHPNHEVFGSSGAARIAMSKAVPVITSSVNHFSDLPTVKADTPEEMAKALEMLFTSRAAKQAQVEKQIEYLQENTWENIAQRYILLFENRFDEINDKK